MNISRIKRILWVAIYFLFILLTACNRTISDTTLNENQIKFSHENLNTTSSNEPYDDWLIPLLSEYLSEEDILGFHDSTFSIDEIAKPGKIIGTVAATALSSGISYTILSGNTDNSLLLNSNTGTITLLKEIDHNIIPVFRLELEATDSQGLNDTAIITINVNRYSQIHNWRLTSTWPSNYILYDIIDDAMRSTLMPKLVELSSNQLQVELIAPSILANYDVYDEVSSGMFEMGHTASAVYTNKGLANEFFTSQPFGLTEAQHTAWLAAEGQALWDELNAQDNMIAFSAGTSGEKSLGWFRQEITTPSQINGLRWRLTGLSGEQEIARRMGANVLTHGELITLGPLYNALRTGTIDAVRYSGAIADFQDNLHASGVYYYPAPDWAQRNVALGLYINLDKYNALPIRLKKAIRDSAELVQQEMSSQYKVQNAQALTTMQALGVKIRVFPQNVLDAFEVHATNLKNEKASVDPFYNRVYQSWKKFR